MTIAPKLPHKSMLNRMQGIMVLAVLLCWVLPTSWATAEVHPSFLYKLSDFDGPIPFKSARIFVDNQRNETYIADTRLAEIRIFNSRGMEVYRFGDDGSLNNMLDMVVSKKGEILVLARQADQPVILRCDFRGRLLETLNLKNLPPAYLAIRPSKMAYWNDQLYLLDAIALKVVVTSTDGLFQKGYDIAQLIALDDKKRKETEIVGFSVDPHGNILFTIPVMFAAFRLSPDGEILSFGHPGSAPGRFGVVVAIVADAQGYYYIADRLKSVVLIFNPQLKFQTEFGYRGRQPHNLISPGELGLDTKGRLYIAQLGYRGVSVFKITHPQDGDPSNSQAEISGSQSKGGDKPINQ